jgi:hypothetical protein
MNSTNPRVMISAVRSEAVGIICVGRSLYAPLLTAEVHLQVDRGVAFVSLVIGRMHSMTGIGRCIVGP